MIQQALAELRNGKKMSQNQVAEQIGVNVSQIRQTEAGKTQPTLDVLRNLAIAHHGTTDELGAVRKRWLR